MRKLFIHILMIACISCFISATPGNIYKATPVAKVSIEKPRTLRAYEEIHPLLILEYRFY